MALLWRRLSLALAILAGLVFTQAPDYLRGYRDRLGGALYEAAAQNAAFEAECNKSGLTRDQGIGRLLGDTDPLVRERGFRLREAPARLNGLRRQAEYFASSDPMVKLAGYFVAPFDREVAKDALDALHVAIPPSTEGFLAGGLAFALTLGFLLLIARPFREPAEPVEKTPAPAPIQRRSNRRVGKFSSQRTP